MAWENSLFQPRAHSASSTPARPYPPQFLCICSVCMLGMPVGRRQAGKGSVCVCGCLWVRSKAMPYAALWVAIVRAGVGRDLRGPGRRGHSEAGFTRGLCLVGVLDSWQSLGWGWGRTEGTTAPSLWDPGPPLPRRLLAAPRTKAAGEQCPAPCSWQTWRLLCPGPAAAPRWGWLPCGQAVGRGERAQAEGRPAGPICAWRPDAACEAELQAQRQAGTSLLPQAPARGREELVRGVRAGPRSLGGFLDAPPAWLCLLLLLHRGEDLF